MNQLVLINKFLLIGGLLAVSNQVTSFPLAAMSGESSIKTVAYEDVKALKDNKDVLLIDVREPSELQKTGVLPGSINIPLGQVENVLKNASPEDFLSKYGRPKPDVNFPLVFSCQSGRRSLVASETAVKLGYKNVSSYGGGWSDWEKKSKQ
ncbi:hypothetical protein ILUMI_01179 [Ignelater luminosus]|uniref:Rhodanese domain-containing protein n=1 Tax=Ignelater luminosus TaxID=2038154 RepID=A0A8K0GHP7_IGNLU|nr:hypothetical protein ILUMI_01179 [Ignelater luminosus]